MILNARNILVSVLLSLPAVCAAESSLQRRFQVESGVQKFASQELTLDVFGSAAINDGSSLFDGSRLGIGSGVNYFFTQWLGIGADTRIEKLDWPNHLNGSVIGRYPIEKLSLAPYAFMGIGREFHDNPQWMYHIGGGVDYRLNRSTGFFLDLRHTFTDATRNYNLWRLGVRLKF